MQILFTSLIQVNMRYDYDFYFNSSMWLFIRYDFL